MILYKYLDCGTHAWDVLRNCELFFAQPDWLNDPLDSSINITNEYEAAKEVVRRRNKSEDARESFLMFLLDSHYFSDKASDRRMGLNSVLQIYLSQLGILSFSKVSTDALLWAHYSKGHRGICLGFEADELKFPTVFAKAEVQYLDKPPYVELFLEMVEELGKFVKPWDGDMWSPEIGDKFYTSQIKRLTRANLFVKSEKWRYEQEYRFVSSISGLHRFSAMALREVIRGVKLSQLDRDTLDNVLRDPRYNHVRLLDIRHLQGSFDMEVVAPSRPAIG